MMAMLKLRWQISRNQARKLGTFHATVMLIFAILVMLSSVIAFFAGLISGYNLLPQMSPDLQLILWDAIVLTFLACWLLGTLTELQQSEMLSLNNFLHLPVTLYGAFVLNYLSVWFSFSLAFFLPLMTGLGIATVVTQGSSRLLIFPLILGFLSMVTCVTYQFRGWLARIMQNKRRRGTVMAIITMSCVMLAQVPNLINLTVMRNSRNSIQQVSNERVQKQAELLKELQEQRITQDEFNAQFQKLHHTQPPSIEARIQGSLQESIPWLRLINLALPIGWLPFGVHSLANGSIWPALLGSSAMFSIGIVSLWGSYHGTMRAYTGQNSSPEVAAPTVTAPTERKTRFVEREIPGISPAVSTVALASLCSVLRSQEGKMILLTPILILASFCGFLIFGPLTQTPVFLIPGIAIGVIGTTQLAVSQFLFNSFGLDRDGFRAYILSPLPRAELLRGKNFSFFPIVVAMNIVLLGILAIAMPFRLTHFVATLLQGVISFLLICLLGNLLSIRIPIRLSAGTVKPQAIHIGPLLIAFLCTLLTPLFYLPAASALGLEYLLEFVFGIRQVPMYLLLTLIELPIVYLIYNRVLIEQGKLLQQRETRILEIVSIANE